MNAWPRVHRCLLTTLPIYSADAFAGLIEGECVDESIPHAVESDEYLREYIRRTTITIYHPVRQVPCTPVSTRPAVLTSRRFLSALPSPPGWDLQDGRPGCTHHSRRPSVPCGGPARPTSGRRVCDAVRDVGQHDGAGGDVSGESGGPGEGGQIDVMIRWRGLFQRDTLFRCPTVE